MHVGYDPVSGKGVIGFSRDRGTDLEMVELWQAPGSCIYGGDDLQGSIIPRALGGACVREITASG